MINKIYDKLKIIIKENYKHLLILFLLIFIMTFKLPYYISAPGGLIDVSKRIETKENFELKGSLNMAYVTEFEGILPVLFIAFINDNWDIETEKEATVGSESMQMQQLRNKLLLKETNSKALEVVYNKSNIKYQKENCKDYVTYVDDLSNTNLEVGDQIVEVDGKKIKDKNHIHEIIKSKKIGEKVKFKVINNSKKKEKYATLIDVQNEAKVGILITEIYDLKSNHKINLKFKNTESGSSGGLMLSLTLYSYLNKIDLTNGKKVVGTGTIDENGNVGEISGVKYKLIGAVKNGADLFLVPAGANFEEAKKVKKENNYDIKLVPIKNFDQAVEYLKK